MACAPRRRRPAACETRILLICGLHFARANVAPLPNAVGNRHNAGEIVVRAPHVVVRVLSFSSFAGALARRALHAVLALFALLIALPAAATNDAANGLVLYNANGCEGCHSAHTNAAGAPNVIDYAINVSSAGQMVFPALTASDKSDIAAYLATLITNPVVDSTPANTAKAINIPDIDLVTTNAFTSLSTQSGPSHGSVSYSGTTATYTPTPNYVGADSFTLIASGPAGSSSVRTVNITVVAPPAPVAGAISANVPNSTPFEIDLGANVSGGMTGVSIASNPTHGTVTLSGNIATYMPEIGYQGADSFTYRATGLGGTSAPGNVSITVGPPVLPVAGNTSATLPANAPLVINLVPAITGYSAGVTVVAAPAHGTVTVAANKVTYTPAAGYFGADSFTYYATNVTGNSNTATVALTVLPPPPVSAALAVAVDYNTAKTIDLAPSIQGVADSIAITVPPTHGTAVVNGKQVLYTPAQDYVGSDAFTWKATNTGGDSPPAVVSLTVRPPAPVARDTTMSVPLNTATTLDLAPFVTALDVSGIVVVAQPAHGTVTVNGTRVTFTPTHDYFGDDSFTYAAFSAAFSGTEPSAPARVRVAIVGRPDLAADKTLGDLVAAQGNTAKRFARAQIANIQSRLEALHRGGPSPAAPPSLAGMAPRASLSAAVAPASTSLPVAGLSRLAPDVAPALPALEVGTIHAQQAHARASAGTPTDTLVQSIGQTLLAAGSVAQSGTLNLSAGARGMSMGVDEGASDPGVSLWVAGGMRFGHRERSSTGLDVAFKTDGATIGVDRRFGRDLALGIALGYAQDTTNVGSDGSGARAKGMSTAIYGSYRLHDLAYVDGILGLGTLDFDTRRHVAAWGEYALGNREGSQWFASLTAGHEIREGGFGFSPYARLDYTHVQLDKSVERGGQPYALMYGEQSVPAAQVSLGLRAESAHEWRFGYVLPRVRIELQREHQSDGHALVAYADQGLASAYRIATPGVRSNALVIGAGGEMLFADGLSIGLDYQTRRTADKDADNALVVRLTQQLDGKSVGRPAQTLFRRGKPLWLDLDFSYTWDDNVLRSNEDEDGLADEILGVHLSKRTIYPWGNHMRLVTVAHAGGEHFRTYHGLGHFDAGLDAEVQYRADGDFATATWGLFATALGESYESRRRDGVRWSAGVTMRRAITDRINLFASLAHNERNARGTVFDTRDDALRANLDYDLADSSAVYLRSEWRRGDIVSTGAASLGTLDLAKVLAEDDAIAHRELFVYRLAGDTALYTLGYNKPLGNKDSLDFSFRHVASKPTGKTTIPGWSAPHYFVNQLMLTYLTSF